MAIPSGAICPARTKVMLALLAEYDRDGRATVRQVGSRASLQSPATAHHHLTALKRDALVAMGDGIQGDLRPTVGIVVGPWLGLP